MALSRDDVNAVRAQWEEWTADAGFELSIEVKADQMTEVVSGGGDLMARFAASSYVQVQVRRVSETIERRETVLVFDERVRCDPAALRASVTVLARTIAAWAERGDV